jgi:hypothetical protein
VIELLAVHPAVVVTFTVYVPATVAVIVAWLLVNPLGPDHDICVAVVDAVSVTLGFVQVIVPPPVIDTSAIAPPPTVTEHVVVHPLPSVAVTV